ncbi:MAG: hypothetical protein AB7U97_04065 [Pirellulales bacterium]
MCALAAMAVATIGCGDGRPARTPVSGQVLIDGKPLTHGFVRFVPKNSRPSQADLDENGRFTLSCYGEQDGVVPGVHKVEVNGSEYLSSTEIMWHAPKKYASFRFSPLTQEVTEATDSMVINLSWDGGKPFKEKVK